MSYFNGFISMNNFLIDMDKKNKIISIEKEFNNNGKIKCNGHYHKSIRMYTECKKKEINNDLSIEYY